MGCCAGVNQNYDPYTMQKGTGVERLNQASVVSTMIRHSENSDQKTGGEKPITAKSLEPSVEREALPLAKQEEHCIEGSTGASKNIQVQNCESTETTIQ